MLKTYNSLHKVVKVEWYLIGASSCKTVTNYFDVWHIAKDAFQINLITFEHNCILLYRPHAYIYIISKY